MKNLLVAGILEKVAEILELQEVPFKPQAYLKAARSISELSEDVTEIAKRGELQNISGVGESIAEKIEEIIKTGKLKYYEQLKKKLPIDFEELGQIPSLGPKKIKFLYQKLKIKNLKDLEKALQEHKLLKLRGFGAETEKNLQQGLELVKSHPQRFLYAQALPLVEEVKTRLGKLPFVKKIDVAGSFRRGKETVGDLDFLIVSSQPEKATKAFVNMPDVKDILAQGPTKSSVRLNNNLQMDLRVVSEKEWGSALLYFIGNKEHNIELRKLALSKGYTLSEYGLFKLKGKKWIAGRTEQEIYDQLGMKYIPPELRENMGEIKASLQNKLPPLVELKDIKGLFHNHSTWSDGTASILEMAQAAEKLGLKFLAITDHYSPIGITNPLNEKRLEKYLAEIEKVRKKVSLELFSGVEIDILKDGSLPLSAAKLKQVDVVEAAVHLSTKMSEAEMTTRICSALENYPVNILAHPRGRLLNRREPFAANWEKVFSVAKKNKVFLECTCSPARMDLSGEKIKTALDAGCKIALGTDAHSTAELNHYKQGILALRRGWAEKKDILNCWDLSKIKKELKK